MWPIPALLDTDVITRAAVIEGYNTNTYQSQDDPNVPIIRRHPSPFTGVDATLELRFLGRDTDRTTIIVNGVMTFEYDKCTGKLPGRVIRTSAYQPSAPTQAHKSVAAAH